MFIEMLDSTFHGIYRDIGDAVKTYTSTHNVRDYSDLDQIVIDTFHKTEKPVEVPQKLWDEFLETFRIGIEVGLGLDDDVEQVMHAVIARASRHVGNRIIACRERHEAHRSDDDLWAKLVRDGRLKIIGVNENGNNIYQAV
jgi:hypothetical protein